MTWAERLAPSSRPVPRRRPLFLVLALVFVVVPFGLKGALLHFPHLGLTRVVIAPLFAQIRPWDNVFVVGSILVSAVFWVAYLFVRAPASRA